MKRFLPIVALLLFPFCLSAQSKFRMGYILNNSNDTLKGYIRYPAKQINPNRVEFKAESSAESRILTMSDCAGFGVVNGSSFKRAVVDISMNNTNVNRLFEIRDTAKLGTKSNLVVKESVFLKILQRGENIALFSYTDKLKTRFYIQNKVEAEPVELIMNVYSDLGTIVKERTYLRQLLLQMQKYIPNLSLSDANINGVQYAEDDLIEVVSKINNQSYTKPVFQSISFFAGAGINMTSASYNGSHVLAGPAATSKSSTQPMILLGVDVPANPEVGRLIYRFDLQMLMSQDAVSTESDTQSSTSTTHSFNQINVFLVPQVICNLYNTRSMKIYIGAGAGGGISIYDKNISTLRYKSGQFPDEVTENPVDLNSFNLLLKVSAGMLINKRIELSAGYYPKSAIATYTKFKTSIQRSTLGIHYHFGKK